MRLGERIAIRMARLGDRQPIGSGHRRACSIGLLGPLLCCPAATGCPPLACRHVPPRASTAGHGSAARRTARRSPTPSRGSRAGSRPSASRLRAYPPLRCTSRRRRVRAKARFCSARSRWRATSTLPTASAATATIRVARQTGHQQAMAPAPTPQAAADRLARRPRPARRPASAPRRRPGHAAYGSAWLGRSPSPSGRSPPAPGRSSLELARRREIAPLDLAEQLRQVLVVKGSMAGQQAVEGCAQAVDVAGRTQVGRSARRPARGSCRPASPAAP